MHNQSGIKYINNAEHAFLALLYSIYKKYYMYYIQYSNFIQWKILTIKYHYTNKNTWIESTTDQREFNMILESRTTYIHSI